jgi:hypothetical protein
MQKFLARLLVLGVGIYITYCFGQDAILPIVYRFTGEVTEGRISGFAASNGVSINRDGDLVKGRKPAPRKPAFMYHVGPSATDSLEGTSSTAAFTLLSNYVLNEHVTVVYDPNSPSKAYIIGFQLIIGALICVSLGLFGIKMGITGRA